MPHLEITWEAVYKNDDVFKQVDRPASPENRYDRIDRRGLKEFRLCLDGVVKVTVPLNNKRVLFHRRRVYMSLGGTDAPPKTILLAGYTEGSAVRLWILFDDGSVEKFPDGFINGHEYAYPIIFRDDERGV